jgi:D-alanyl-D-alanine carboxypeptidase
MTSALVRIHLVALLLLGAPLDTLVSREHGLPEWYAPGEWEEARQALDALIQDLGLPVRVASGYRSFEVQAEAYARVVGQYGQERADQVIARPGHSEHQLGTAFDLAWAGVPIEWDVPRNRQLWEALSERAHRYGFVLSYPRKESDNWPYSNRWYPLITEVRWEPWHIRYVGVELATAMVDRGYLDPRSSVLPQDFYTPWPGWASDGRR